MNLKRKIGCQLFCGIIAVLVLAQAIQYYQALKSNGMLSKSSGNLLRERDLQHVQSIQSAINFSISECMARGDMEVFQRVVRLGKDIPGLLELSLYNRKGKVTDSSLKGVVGRQMEASLQSELNAKTARVVRETPQKIEIYQPELATAKCMECHDDYEPGKVAGVVYIAFSNDARAKLDADFATLTSAANKRWQALSFGILGVGALVVIVLTLLITRPIIGSLTSIAEGLSANGSGVCAASGELASASQAIAEGASNQAATLEETSASLTEITSMTERNAQGARAASELAREARTLADAGSEDMKALSGKMEELKLAGDDISKIIKTIEGIAFQTNLLALNASVEAARAGQAGLGFAVVADEVRNLAQHCSDAARETAAKVELTLSRTRDGVRLSGKSEVDLKQILDRVHKLDGLIAGVAAASQEQSRGIEQISAGIIQIEKITQENAAGAEEGASASEELNGQARSLQNDVRRLMALIHGSSDQVDAFSPSSTAAAVSSIVVSSAPAGAQIGNRTPNPEQSSRSANGAANGAVHGQNRLKPQSVTPV